MSHLQGVIPAVHVFGMISGIANVILATYGLSLRFKSNADQDRVLKSWPWPLMGCLFFLGIQGFVHGAFEFISPIGYTVTIVKTLDIVCMIGILPLSIYQFHLLAQD
jgi:hypothetical protein